MQSVSDSFKKAIKSENREIHGYVEIIYNDIDVSVSYDPSEFPGVSNVSMTDATDLIDGIRVMKNYATLENNYFLLDGSFLLPNINTLHDSGGYTSNDIFSNINDNTITLNASSEGVATKGFTIFFKDNIPFDFNISITTDNDQETIEIRNNSKHYYQKIFEEDATIESLSLEILNIEYQDRRIRIPDISFSLVDLYEGDELVKFDVDEEIDLMALSLPIGTCSININNYPDENGYMKFDVLNPTGIVPYLNDNVIIKPHIGVLTETNGIEYVKMGVFYLKDWSSDNDNNVTINGINAIGKISDINAEKDDNDFFSSTYINSYSDRLNYALKDMSNFDFDLSAIGLIANMFLSDTNIGKWLLSASPFLTKGDAKDRFLNVTRNNIITNKHFITESPIDYISRNNLLSDIKITLRNLIKKFDITIYGWSNADGYGVTSEKKDVLKTEYTLHSSTDYVWYEKLFFTGFRDSDPTITYNTTGSGSVEMVSSNGYLILLKYTGEPGDSFTNVTVNDWTYNLEPWPRQRIAYSNVNNGDTISVDFHKQVDNTSTYAITNMSNFYTSNKYKKDIKASTIGDPSLECGDKISIQTRYNDENDGYKNMVITKQHFVFDGGLSCDLEGMSG